MKKSLLIGELSQRLHLSTQTIRYYERVGLLNPPKRTGSQYRLYGADEEERLRFIQKAKQFGLSLDEIKQLIEIRTNGAPPCSNLKRMVKQHLDELDQKIRDMLVLRQELASRYEAIETLLPDTSDITTEAYYDGKICGLIEQSSETSSTEGNYAT
ncbi:MAG: heavy metal-responsive transcriptional regulator [Thermostichus sp. BF3_bins_97]